MRSRFLSRRVGFLLCFPLYIASANAQDSAVFGPAEKISTNQASLGSLGMTYLTVLGQTYEVKPTAAVVIGDKRFTAAQSMKFLSLGAYISIAGTDAVDGRHEAEEIIISPRMYVPGASAVFVSGVVTAYDSTLGVAQIGSLLINTTPLLASNPSQHISVGSHIEVLGTQASLGGVVWAVEAKSISGTGATVQSISGTGATVQSISGTGATVQSISGTGKTVQSISGTGATVQSISGTGKIVQSISGTGATVQSISGTGKTVQSISGTGATVQSISGTGKTVQSISGTGATVQSISGTGKTVQSISGTGATVQSISGTGVSALSISGTG
jgi:hypothetical protein